MTPISRLVVEPAVIVVRADSPFKTLRDVMNAALKEGSKIRQAGGSPLARDALVRQLLMAESGGKWAFVSFPAASERLAALLGGHVDFVLLEPPEAGELIRAGKLRARGADRREAAARLRERADLAGGRLQDAERAAGARHRRSARHAGGRGGLLRGHAGEDGRARRPGRSS